VAAVALVCNFGYAINEIFDVEEDQRAQRANETNNTGPRRLTRIALLSAVGALGVSHLAAGAHAVFLTLGALLLPVLYSAPPIRLKERKLLGVSADAAAAHAYPAALCLLLLLQVDSRPGDTIVWAVLVWSFALGVRGILTHQLLDEDKDRSAGLRTIVHDLGRSKVIVTILRVVLPLELLALTVTVVLSRPTPVFVAVLFGYSVYELVKLLLGWKIRLFERCERPYLPFLNGGFYEVWGPLGAALPAGLSGERLLLPLVLVLIFYPRTVIEARMVLSLARDLKRRVRET
jgi:4-hydroxybenzoate polyprenyltransferase